MALPLFVTIIMSVTVQSAAMSLPENALPELKYCAMTTTPVMVPKFVIPPMAPVFRGPHSTVMIITRVMASKPASPSPVIASPGNPRTVTIMIPVPFHILAIPPRAHVNPLVWWIVMTIILVMGLRAAIAT